MATSDGITADDWNRVHALTVDLVNATDETSVASCRRRLFQYLEILESKYGPLPSILATRADFTEDISQKDLKLRKAYEYAEERSDYRNALYIAHSLAALHLEETGDLVEGRIWLERMRHQLIREEDAWFAEELQRLRDLLGDESPG